MKITIDVAHGSGERIIASLRKDGWDGLANVIELAMLNPIDAANDGPEVAILSVGRQS